MLLPRPIVIPFTDEYSVERAESIKNQPNTDLKSSELTFRQSLAPKYAPMQPPSENGTATDRFIRRFLRWTGSEHSAVHTKKMRFKPCASFCPIPATMVRYITSSPPPPTPIAASAEAMQPAISADIPDIDIFI